MKCASHHDDRQQHQCSNQAATPPSALAHILLLETIEAAAQCLGARVAVAGESFLCHS
jgi:hypothetical protein